MRAIDAEAAGRWMAAEGWPTVPDGPTIALTPAAGVGLIRREVESNIGDTSVGCGMAANFMHDVPASTFAGGLLWVQDCQSGDEHEMQFARRVLKGCGMELLGWPAPGYFELSAGEADVCQDVLALSLMFHWDSLLLIAGRRLAFETDHDGFPAIVAESISDWMAKAMTNLSATITPWPFWSRFFNQ